MAPAKFSPGFRFSALDAVVLVVGVAGVAAAGVIEWWLGLALGIPLAAFFVFCNVFRVSRPLELLWAAGFLALAAATVVRGVPGWWAYHGVGWRRIDLRLVGGAGGDSSGRRPGRAGMQAVPLPPLNRPAGRTAPAGKLLAQAPPERKEGGIP